MVVTVSLIPAPKHIIIDKDENGKYKSINYSDRNKPTSIYLKILGYEVDNEKSATNYNTVKTTTLLK